MTNSIIVNKPSDELVWPDDFINKVICGDCLEVMKKIPDGAVDAVVTDPPYGIDLQPPRGCNPPIQNDTAGAATKLWCDVVPKIHRGLKDKSASLVFGAWSEMWFAQRLADWFTLKGCICWDKVQFGIGYYLRPQFELAWYIHKGTPPVPERAASNVWRIPRLQKPIHACEKPIILLERGLQLCSSTGDLILDPFLGSGTTAVAAKQLGRRFIGIEISMDYCKIAEDRLRQQELF